MKKSIKTIISFMTVVLLILSFSSCTLFEAMRQNALLASQIVIENTPEAGEVIDVFNNTLKASMESAVEIKENVSYSAGKPEVMKGEEEAGILDAAANQLKTFIMSANPGSTSRVVDKDTEDTLLNTIDDSFVLKFDFTRNIATENVTDDKGENVKDEEGNAVTETKISDNVLHLTFNYFDSIPASQADTTENATEVETTEAAVEDITTEETVVADTTEAITDETTEADTTTEADETAEATEAEASSEETTEEETTIIYADDATIETVFGSLKDKAAVLKNFENIKDYITVSDYEIEYTNCTINSDIDLSNGTVSFVTFQKNMKVTAKITGVGDLAEYGEMVVTFTLVQTTTYEFSYPEEAEDTTALDADTTAEETTATVETTEDALTTDAEETTGEAVTEVATEETTAA